MVVDNTVNAATWADVASAYWTASGATATWTVGLLGLVINAIGLVALIKQLGIATAATQAATKAANVAASEGRPWVDIAIASARVTAIRIDGEAEVRSLDVTFKLANVGKTPALQCFVGLGFFQHGPVKFEDLLAMQEPTGGFGRTVFPDNEIEMTQLFPVPEVLWNAHEWNAVVYAQYRIPGSEDFSYTPKTILFVPGDLIDVSPLAPPASGIALRFPVVTHDVFMHALPVT